MRTTINDPRIVGCETGLQLGLSVAAIESYDRDQWETLEMVLGTLWSAEQFREDEERVVLGPNGLPMREKKTEKPKTPSKIRMPLLIGIKPEIMQTLRDRFGIGRDSRGTLGDGTSIGKDVTSLYNLSKEDYLEFIGQRPAVKRSTGIVKEKK